LCFGKTEIFLLRGLDNGEEVRAITALICPSGNQARPGFAGEVLAIFVADEAMTGGV